MSPLTFVVCPQGIEGVHSDVTKGVDSGRKRKEGNVFSFTGRRTSFKVEDTKFRVEENGQTVDLTGQQGQTGFNRVKIVIFRTQGPMENQDLLGLIGVGFCDIYQGRKRVYKLEREGLLKKHTLTQFREGNFVLLFFLFLGGSEGVKRQLEPRKTGDCSFKKFSQQL